MDPASAAITFIVTGFQVIKLIKETLDNIRGAPEALELLKDRVTNVEMLMRELEHSQLQALFDTKEDLDALEHLGSRAKKLVDDIEAFVTKMRRVGKDGTMRISRTKWLFKGDKLEELSVKLDRLQNALNSIINLSNSYVQPGLPASRRLLIGCKLKAMSPKCANDACCMATSTNWLIVVPIISFGSLYLYWHV